MTTYVVSLRRTVVERGEIEVEADNEDDAAKLAIDKEARDPDYLTWEYYTANDDVEVRRIRIAQ